MGVGSLDVDQRRFPRVGGGYASPDFETAPNRAEIRITSYNVCYTKLLRAGLRAHHGAQRAAAALAAWVYQLGGMIAAPVEAR